MATVNLVLSGDDYFKEVNLFSDGALGKEVLEIILASGERIKFQFEDISQNEELINKLIDAHIARKRQMGKFVLRDL